MARPQTPWWDAGITADALTAKDFPPLTYLVRPLMAKGCLTLLVGPPKSGKSYLALGVAFAVAGGGPALDQLKVEHSGDVLFISLDDQSERRAKQRLLQVANGNQVPNNLTLYLGPGLDRGPAAARQLTEYLDTHPACVLLVVDTLEHLRGRAGDDSPYTADVRFLGQLRSVLADHPDVALLVLHHTRKADEDEDPITAVSGTHGVAGGADAILRLAAKRGSTKRVLDIVSRDGADRRLVLTFTSRGLTYSPCDDPDDPMTVLTADDARVFQAVQGFGGAVTATELQDLLPDIPKVGNRLGRLFERGYLHKQGRGRYVTS